MGGGWGVDGVAKAQYGQDLKGNLCDLRERLVSKRSAE